MQQSTESTPPAEGAVPFESTSPPESAAPVEGAATADGAPPVEAAEEVTPVEEVAALIEDNEVASQAVDAVQALFDGSVTSTDLSNVWTFVGWPIVKVVLLIFAVVILGTWARRLAMSALTRLKVETTLAKFLSNLAKWAIYALGGITVLQTFGIQATSFAAVLAAVGFAIGMALSGTLGHLASSIILLLFRPFKVGDYVVAGGAEGTVEEVGLFTTAIDTLDNRRIFVPNGEIAGTKIENMTHHAHRRCDVSVGVAYDADTEETRRVLDEVANNISCGLADPAPKSVLIDLGDSSVNWEVRVFVEPANYLVAKEEITEKAKRALDRAGITIPFPQVDVHMQATG